MIVSLAKRRFEKAINVAVVHYKMNKVTKVDVVISFNGVTEEVLEVTKFLGERGISYGIYVKKDT